MASHRMNPLDYVKEKDLLHFFHCSKTQISCLEKPETFLRQLMDYDLIPVNKYKELCKMRSKELKKKCLYEILDWFETECPQYIQVFWRCVSKVTILNEYPILQLLWKSLIDGSFSTETQLLESVTKGGASEKEIKKADQTDTVKKKRKTRSSFLCNEEGSGSSSLPSPPLKKLKPHYYSPHKKGEKTRIWTWEIYKAQLPVTCGHQMGTLNRDRLARGEKCILVHKTWFTPTEFECLSGREKSKNWKLSIKCMETPLRSLIKEGHLKVGRFKKEVKKVKRRLIESADSLQEGDDEESEEDEVTSLERDTSSNETSSDREGDETSDQHTEASRNLVYDVTCGCASGKLHTKRFASGSCGKSIRTETGWITPEVFSTAACWRDNIFWKGIPLSVLIEEEILRIHPASCRCELCSLDKNDADNQKNDDKCSVCRRERELVGCDECPRSFHPTCHLPCIMGNIVEDKRQWICTFCVYKTSQHWHYSQKLESEEPLSHQVSRHLLECQYLLLFLYDADEEQLLTTNQRQPSEDNTTRVETPVGLGQIAEKLLRNDYLTVEDFVSDIQLVFSGCSSRNPADDQFTMCNALKDLFNRELKNVFHLPDTD